MELSSSPLFIDAILGKIIEATISIERSDRFGLHINVIFRCVTYSKPKDIINVELRFEQKRTLGVRVIYKRGDDILFSEFTTHEFTTLGEVLLFLERLPPRVKNILTETLFKFKTSTPILTYRLLTEPINEEDPSATIDGKSLKITNSWNYVFNLTFELYNNLQDANNTYNIIYDVRVCNANCRSIGDGQLGPEEMLNYKIKFKKV
jgi:hypothetical protein